MNSAETMYFPSLLQQDPNNGQVFLNPVSPQGKDGHIQISAACLNSCFSWAVQGFAASDLGLGSSYHPLPPSFQESLIPP